LLALRRTFAHSDSVKTSVRNIQSRAMDSLFLALLLLLAAACATPQATLRADAAAYLDQMSSWAPVEAETARTVARIFATEFVDEAELFSQIRDGSPRARRQLEAAMDYHPATNEVRNIHAAYVEAWRNLLKSFDRIEHGLRQGDQEVLAQGRRGLVDWRDRILDVAYRLRELSDRLSLPVGNPTKPSLP